MSEPHQPHFFEDDPESLDAITDLDTDMEVAGAVAEARKKLRITRAVDRLLGPGPVYQGANKTIARLTASGKKYSHLEQLVDPVQKAGLIADLRALARALDKATGHNPTGWHAPGKDLAALEERYAEALLALDPSADVDALEAWMNDDTAPQEASLGQSPAPHPEV